MENKKTDKGIKEFIQMKQGEKLTCRICGKPTKGSMVVFNKNGTAHFSCAMKNDEV